MALNHNLTTLPSEIRQQIFREHFKADTGYVYDASLDKLRLADEAHTPIDLSLRLTCRSIAEDTKHIPFAVNTIQFSTAFCEDWRTLAGCFNLVAAVYRLLETDFVLHLAKHITPGMYSQLDSKFPTFRAKLTSQVASHRAHVESALESHRLLDHHDILCEDCPLSAPSQCMLVTQFIRHHADQPIRKSPDFYQNFGSIHQEDTNLFVDRRDNPGKHKSKGIHAAVSYCLHLIAQYNPNEFAEQVYGFFPHWKGKYSAQEFLNLRSNQWDIPTREEISRMLEMLNIGDHVWQYPDMWHYGPQSFYERDYRCVSPHHLFPDAYLDPLRLGKRFDIRSRSTIGFSAAAAAIRFLGRLPVEQRTQIRKVTLQENVDSVNDPSNHVQGLVPFFKENPLLQVERRVSVFGCISSNNTAVDYMLEKFRGDYQPQPSIWGPQFTTEVSCWLVDALDVLESGISPESFTLLLEAGSYHDLCKDLFQEVIHQDVAKSKAYFTCLENGLFQKFRPHVFSERASVFAIDGRFEVAIQHLVNRTSILRSDFDPGTPEDFESLVEEVKAVGAGDAYGQWFYQRKYPYGICAYLYEDVMTAPRVEVQTWDEYLQAKGVEATELEEVEK